MTIEVSRSSLRSNSSLGLHHFLDLHAHHYLRILLRVITSLSCKHSLVSSRLMQSRVRPYKVYESNTEHSYPSLPSLTTSSLLAVYEELGKPCIMRMRGWRGDLSYIMAGFTKVSVRRRRNSQVTGSRLRSQASGLTRS